VTGMGLDNMGIIPNKLAVTISEIQKDIDIL
jgi:hypothetical protein